MKEEKINILLVEDNPRDAILIQEILKETRLFSYKVSVAETVQSSLEHLQKNKTDIILLDLNLPDSMGEQTFEAIYNLYEEIPIMLASGLEDEELAIKLIHRGAQDYITKTNLDTRTLERSITYSLERSKLRNSLQEELENRIKAEELWRVSELRFQQVSENASEWIWEVDKNGLYTYTSPVIKEVMGYEPEELIGKKYFYDLFSEDQIENNKKLAFEVFARKEIFKDFVNVNRHKDGKEVILSTSGVPMLDNKGNLTGYRGVDIDITERERAKDQMKLFTIILELLNRRNEWQHLIRCILNEIKSFTGFDAVGIRLRDGVDYPYYVQNGFTEPFIKEENFLCIKSNDGSVIVDQCGKPSLECTCGVIISGKTDTSKPYFSAGGSFWTNQSTDLLDLLPDEDTRTNPRNNCIHSGYRSVALIPIHSGDEVVGLLQLNDRKPDRLTRELIVFFEKIASAIGVAYNRTKAEERIIQSDRLKSAFLANMSHEIRTPLNAIMGFSALFSDPDLSLEKRIQFSEIIKSRSTDLLYIISDILEISSLESGNATVTKKQVVVNDILDEMEVDFQQKLRQIKKTNLHLVCEKALSNGQSEIITDGYIMKRVFSNLIDNAIKFTESGTIRFGYQLPDNHILTCYVSDTGIGIFSENHDLIFEHFRQAEIDNLKKLYGGIGLGLSICKGSLALLGGKIWVESVPGEGSTFWFTIPVEHKPNYKLRITKDESHPVPFPLLPDEKKEVMFQWKGKKLLLVEDEESNIEFLKVILSPTEAELICVENGRELRNLYSTLGVFDLVLLDIRLPDTNGWELAKEIKAIRHDLPVIAQTAYAMASDWQKSEEVGCDDYISKPINKGLLLKKISAAFQQGN